jgi:hypothetical protein
VSGGELRRDSRIGHLNLQVEVFFTASSKRIPISYKETLLCEVNPEVVGLGYSPWIVMASEPPSLEYLSKEWSSWSPDFPGLQLRY